MSTSLWLAVLGLGAYHGLNPAMGWPLAVANGMTARRGSAVFATVVPLGAGHLAAMAVVLAPFALVAQLLAWNHLFRAVAALLVIAFGLAKLLMPRHPRFLARIPPTRLAWWSFLMATAHGAGLMLLPVMIGLCGQGDSIRQSLSGLAASGVAIAITVALVHTLATILAGAAAAWACYRWLGLRFIRQSWFNLDKLWAGSLLLSGAAGLTAALA
ncbi:MAG TPA: hypothetical protein VFP68_04015 [Burkholderiaceae bacterium]|nr:hypothetical protein [Burkholderiaceae bacterium]